MTRYNPRAWGSPKASPLLSRASPTLARPSFLSLSTQSLCGGRVRLQPGGRGGCSWAEGSPEGLANETFRGLCEMWIEKKQTAIYIYCVFTIFFYLIVESPVECAAPSDIHLTKPTALFGLTSGQTHAVFILLGLLGTLGTIASLSAEFPLPQMMLFRSCVCAEAEANQWPRPVLTTSLLSRSLTYHCRPPPAPPLPSPVYSLQECLLSVSHWGWICLSFGIRHSHYEMT